MSSQIQLRLLVRWLILRHYLEVNIDSHAILDRYHNLLCFAAEKATADEWFILGMVAASGYFFD